MNLNQVIISILLFVTNIVFAQSNSKELREPFVLKLSVDSINYYEEAIGEKPYFVKENILQIYPSEKLFIETEILNDSIISMKCVKEILFPKKTIIVNFFQNTNEKENEGMMLKVENPFDKELNYKALMFIVGNDKWLRTSIIPVQPKLIGYETWKDVIISLVLKDWKLK